MLQQLALQRGEAIFVVEVCYSKQCHLLLLLLFHFVSLEGYMARLIAPERLCHHCKVLDSLVQKVYSMLVGLNNVLLILLCSLVLDGEEILLILLNSETRYARTED